MLEQGVDVQLSTVPGTAWLKKATIQYLVHVHCDARLQRLIESPLSKNIDPRRTPVRGPSADRGQERRVDISQELVSILWLHRNASSATPL